MYLGSALVSSGGGIIHEKPLSDSIRGKRWVSERAHVFVCVFLPSLLVTNSRSVSFLMFEEPWSVSHGLYGIVIPQSQWVSWSDFEGSNHLIIWVDTLRLTWFEFRRKYRMSRFTRSYLVR